MAAPFPGLSVAPEESLSHYLKEIRKFPMLHADVELDLARRWTVGIGPSILIRVKEPGRTTAHSAWWCRGHGEGGPASVTQWHHRSIHVLPAARGGHRAGGPPGNDVRGRSRGLRQNATAPG